MRWLASGSFVVAIIVAACRQPSQVSPMSPNVETPRQMVAASCPTIARTCDRSVSDAWVMSEVQTACWGCHGKDGSAGHDLVDVAALRAAPIGDMVGSCEMPPNGLSDENRIKIVQWAACTP